MLRFSHCWICATSNTRLQKSRPKTGSPNRCSRLPRGAPCVITSPRREFALSTYRKQVIADFVDARFSYLEKHRDGNAVSCCTQSGGGRSDGDRGFCAKTEVREVRWKGLCFTAVRAFYQRRANNNTNC